ncbi:Inositol-pentakisphosphate 2-kinase [Golovinomyces cichoracearum]|uniref:Inositol-pentakisphosphate 2-kinase n=1 Tax=Golovinomyces cichoracearum TaxID=62708 RepID=A0A420IJD9_9PEZI|nr:Inositol-pentakisphosphate 2-kinase [Golovinomyces cichoracearum]
MAGNLVLPTDVQLKYLNEGAANIVYNICSVSGVLNSNHRVDSKSPDSDAEFSNYANRLLRLRKNLPTTAPVGVSQSNWINYISPLFHPDEIVQQSLVAIKPSGIISRLNDELRDLERSMHHAGSRRRAKSRQGTYLADDEFGLLITDMTPGHHSDIVIEFKPKWLSQSLSAPSNSTRCRQCAVNARLRAQSESSGKYLAKSRNFCPLDLLSDNKNEIIRFVDNLLSPDIEQVFAQRFVDWIRDYSLLRRLGEIQARLDSTGVLNADPLDKELLIAMTLRDCTVFLRISKDSDKIEARIGDLDLKCATKIPSWKQKENQLISGGWYQGNESESLRQPNNCVLSRGR